MNEIYLYIGSAIIILWGIAHLIPVRNIVKGFGDISADSKKVLMMEVIAEGLTLIFLGVVPLLIIFFGFPYSINGFIVYRAEAGLLIVMAVLTLLTGARTPVIWYKICPLVKAITAILFILASMV